MTAAQFAGALRDRLPITLIKPAPILPTDYSSKIIRSDLERVITFNQVAGTKVSGNMTFTVELVEEE